MQDIHPETLKGQFLIAMPALLDPNFYQTVSIICEHNSEGAVGIIINRVHSNLSGEDIFKELKMEYTSGAESIPIFIGGPVHMGEIFMLHGPPFDWNSSLMITSSLALGNTRDIIESIAMGRGPKSFIISIGCAGWGPGQLESEIKENAWLTSPILEDIIFNVPVETRWEEAVKRMGIDPALLSAKAGNA